VTERVAERTIALPFFSRMNEDEVREVCRAVRQVTAEATRQQIAVAVSQEAL
jgi:dTDP-4-amino-4,6-dideoxygalactose transaminase